MRTSFGSGLSPPRSTISMMGEAAARALRKAVIAKKRMLEVFSSKIDGTSVKDFRVCGVEVANDPILVELFLLFIPQLRDLPRRSL
jgi:hypothetical protein